MLRLTQRERREFRTRHLHRALMAKLAFRDVEVALTLTPVSPKDWPLCSGNLDVACSELHRSVRRNAPAGSFTAGLHSVRVVILFCQRLVVPAIISRH